MMDYSMEYASPIGVLTLAGDGESLTGLWLEGQKYFGGSGTGNMIPKDDLPVFAAARTWLDAYFSGRRPDPSSLPLAPRGGEFRRRVWSILREIPYGEVMTYGQIAEMLDCGSAQAVGGAVGHNPISIIIPCHRVVGAGGKLTGFAGGLERKQWLLRHENADF